METSFNVIICNINNLRRIPTFSLVQEFAFHSGSFDQLKSLTWLPPAWQILTSLLRFVLGSSWAKLDRFPKKLGLRKMRAKLPSRHRQSFPWLARKGKVYFPTSCSVLWRLWHESLWTFIFGCETLHPAQPHLSWLNLLFLPLVGESGCAQASCWDVLGSHLPQREKCVGEETCFGMTWQKKLSLKKVVKRVANLTSSGAASISSVNFSAVISEANKLQWEGI